MNIDFKLLADSMDEIREALNAMVAAMVSDGFTEEQAREIVTSLMTSKKSTEDSDGNS